MSFLRPTQLAPPLKLQRHTGLRSWATRTPTNMGFYG